MRYDFWHDKWRRNEIGFHEGTVNQYLASHWQDFTVTGSETVLLPLCGKSRDILWLSDKGHPVIGVELSPIACKDLFEETNLKAQVRPESPFTLYQHNDIQIYCGDFFDLDASHVAGVKTVFDRAALIALPDEMRRRYVDHLHQILPRESQILLVTMEYDPGEMEGPPYSVTEPEVMSLYGAKWVTKQVQKNNLGADDPFAKRKGLSYMTECVYQITKL
ncbi:MAG: thiopurine S-methyltransferase [Pseudomonadales bacterium]|nr:thiopurine S-methyltransferase [Pseudomonadales bacterium]